jgi:hypothetical protein
LAHLHRRVSSGRGPSQCWIWARRVAESATLRAQFDLVGDVARRTMTAEYRFRLAGVRVPPARRRPPETTVV